MSMMWRRQWHGRHVAAMGRHGHGSWDDRNWRCGSPWLMWWWCGFGVMTWRMTWVQEVDVAADMAGLINFASTLFFCAAIALLSFLCCYCWRRGVIAEGEDSFSLLKVVVAAGRFYCFVCGWRLRATTLGAVVDEDLLMARRGWHWLRRCHRRGFTAAGVGDQLWLLKAMALWTVADEDLLCCLCCGEPPVGAGCDGFVGGYCWWFCAVVPEIHWCLLRCQSGGCRWSVSKVANQRGSMDWCAGLLGALQDLTVLPTKFFRQRKTHIPSVN